MGANDHRLSLVRESQKSERNAEWRECQIRESEIQFWYPRAVGTPAEKKESCCGGSFWNLSVGQII